MSVTGEVSLPKFDCLPSLNVNGLPVSFVWSAALAWRPMTAPESEMFWSGATVSGRQLFVKKNILAVDVTYELTLSAEVGAELAGLVEGGSNKYHIRVIRSDLAVGISGGSRRTAGAVSLVGSERCQCNRGPVSEFGRFKSTPATCHPVAPGCSLILATL